MCLNVIKVAIFQRAWSHVSAHVIRAENLSEVRESALAAAAAASTTSMGTSGTNSGSSLATATTSSKRASTRLASGSSASSSRPITGGVLGLIPTPPGSAGAASAGSIASAFSAAGCGQTYRDAMAQARTQLAIAGGLVELATSNYRGAANYFLMANYDHLESPGRYSLITPSDLAYYVTLCCLATFDRPELACRVMGSPNFRLLLEAEPVCREVLTSFHVQADYATCLQRLHSVKDVLQLDIFLADHVNILCREIRSRAICQ
ncbi:unnamed protein product [Protopolystoma xenopodis]|uniref:26S proteasome regulatory subunit Rpn7 N-terminal domain-containing protein n=1 Tax=Protopolystoma xenopodis TaxID=117903 RepID=A0A3S5B566_9PLAT|nr:unnamed protein product [Protopolystoma xenopodis]